MARELTLEEQKEAMYAEIMERVQNEQRIREEKRSKNTFEYGGQLTELRMSNPRQRTRDVDDGKGGKTKVPVLDENQQPTFWDAQYYCTLVQMGGSEQFAVSLELGKDLVEGHWYSFEGSRGGEGKKDKVRVITEI